MKCPHCDQEIPEAVIRKHIATLAGRVTSERKAQASRENGKRGGRPRRDPEK